MAHMIGEARERVRRLLAAAEAAQLGAQAGMLPPDTPLPPPPEAWSDWRVSPAERSAMADIAVRMTDLRTQLAGLLAGEIKCLDLGAVEADIRAAAEEFVRGEPL